MVIRHGHELAFWRWWWDTRAPATVRVGAVVVLLAGLLAGGIFAAERLTTANAGVHEADVLTYVTTVERVVTVHGPTRTVRKVVPVVKHSAGRQTTVLRTQTELQTQVQTQTRTVFVPTTKTKVQTVRETVVRTVPVSKPQVVLVKTVTVHDTVTVTVTSPSP
jgi:hypothetical protein